MVCDPTWHLYKNKRSRNQEEGPQLWVRTPICILVPVMQKRKGGAL